MLARWHRTALSSQPPHQPTVEIIKHKMPSRIQVPLQVQLRNVCCAALSVQGTVFSWECCDWGGLWFLCLLLGLLCSWGPVWALCSASSSTGTVTLDLSSALFCCAIIMLWPLKTRLFKWIYKWMKIKPVFLTELRGVWALTTLESLSDLMWNSCGSASPSGHHSSTGTWQRYVWRQHFCPG